MFLTNSLTTLPVPLADWGRPLVRTRMALVTGMPAGHSLRATFAGAVEDMASACELARSSGLGVSVAAQGELTELPGIVAAALSRSGVSALRLEVAVSGLQLAAGLEDLLALSALRDLGVGVALHGLGRDTLSLVSRLPLSAVILASEAIADVPGSPASLALLQALVGLARRHALTVVAAGIECEVQRAVLSGLGCDFGEGDLFEPAGPHH